MKTFELAPLNLFTPQKKRGGEPLAIHRHVVAGAGVGGDGDCGQDLDLVGADGDGGGFDPAAANRGAHAGLVNGIASRPTSKPKQAATPATGAPPQPQLPNLRDAFAKALGAIPPAMDRQGTVR